MSDIKFSCDYARMGTSSCKKCKQKLEKGSLRVAKITPNPFTDGDGEMKNYFHSACLFETFVKCRSTTKVISELDDIQFINELKDEDKKSIEDLINDLNSKRQSPKKLQTKQTKITAIKSSPKIEFIKKSDDKNSVEKSKNVLQLDELNDNDNEDKINEYDKSNDKKKINHNMNVIVATKEELERDNSFREFRKLCSAIADVNGHIEKTRIISNFIDVGTNGKKYHGDLYLLFKLLLPGHEKTVYHLHDKQLIKAFSEIFGCSIDDLSEHLEAGDVSETIATFYSSNKKLPPLTKSTISMQEVDSLLMELSTYTKEEDQMKCLKKITNKCSINDLKIVIRLIKHDIRINSGSKIILDALGSNAYEAFKATRNLKDVINRIIKKSNNNSQTAGAGSSTGNCNKSPLKKDLSVSTKIMVPFQPMLAEACKSIEQAFGKCPNGMFAEIKYDGERLQLHKQGNNFAYFSRSLKTVLPHKVQHLKDFIPKAFPGGSDLILDSEILLIDNKTSKPLPFGTLGVHKKQAFVDANVCLFIFDCLHYNGQDLLNKTIKERREILKKNVVEIPNHIMLSEMTFVTKKEDLSSLMLRVFQEGLEGLVLKDINGIYEPGKRHWLKVKKDYLAGGAMADSADLVVLGAYFGTGSKGGMKSVFLLGVLNKEKNNWCTVTKCGSGLDDRTLQKLQSDISMTKISKDNKQVPSWLNVHRTIVPDFVVDDPKKSQVWEIIGTEFSKSDVHTAAGISIRFPRILKLREDKTWKEATDLDRLKKIFEESKKYCNIADLTGGKIGPKTKNNLNKAMNPSDKKGYSSPSCEDDNDYKNKLYSKSYKGHRSSKNNSGFSFINDDEDDTELKKKKGKTNKDDLSDSDCSDLDLQKLSNDSKNKRKRYSSANISSSDEDSDDMPDLYDDDEDNNESFSDGSINMDEFLQQNQSSKLNEYNTNNASRKKKKVPTATLR